MEKVRIGNDMRVNFSVYRNGQPESFDGASNIVTKLVNEAYNKEITHTYTIVGNVVQFDIDALQLTQCGKCRLFISYTKGGDYTVDSPAFELVNYTDQTGGTEIVGVEIVSINISGDIGINRDGLSAYEVWEAYPGNEGKTIEQYFLWLRENPTKIDLDGLNSNIDKLHFKADTLVQLTNIGDVRYSTESKTLEVKVSDTVSIQLGQEMQTRVKNDEAIQINNGQMVYINSAVGANPLAKIASTSNADIAQRTFGMATENIAANQFGAITTEGLVRDINTSAFPEGAMLWLGTNGNVTNIEPIAPVSKISVGMVLRSNVNNGIVYVKIRAIARNQKLSDVYAPTMEGGDVLRWNSTTLRFETFNITSELSNKVDTSRTITAGNGLTGGGSLTGDRTININPADDSLTVTADNVKVNTNNTLTSTSTTQPLSANQGKVLNEKAVQLETDLNEMDITVNGGNIIYNNYTIGKAIATNLGVGKVVNTAMYNDNAKCAIIACKLKDKFIITGKGASTARLWCFTNVDYVCMSVSSASIINENEEIVSPSDGYLIVNFQNSYIGESKLLVIYASIEDKIFNILETTIIPSCDNYAVVEPINVTNDYAVPNNRTQIVRIQTYYEFLSSYYDSLIASSTQNYTIKKRSLGVDSSNRYEIFEYDFIPKNYNKVVLLSAGMNALETSPIYGLAFFMRDVVLQNVDIAHEYFRKNVRFKVIPILCPYSFDQELLLYGNYNGVNINRNFNYNNSWDKMSSTVGVWDYKGVEADSEQETKILKKWLNENGKMASLYLDCHSDVGGTSSAECAAICSSGVYSLVIPEWKKIKSFYLSKGFDMRYGSYTALNVNYPKTNYSYDVCGCRAIMIEQWPSNGTRFGSDGNTSADMPGLVHYMMILRGAVLSVLRSEVSIFDTDNISMRLYQLYLNIFGK